MDPWGYLYAVTKGRFVDRFDPFGKYIDSITLESKDNIYEFISYSGFVSVDERGYIYVVNTSSGKVSIYSPTGAFVGDLVKSGYGTYDLTMVNAVAIDSRGNIYVAGSLPRSTVSRFEPNYIVIKRMNYQGHSNMTFGPIINAFIGGIVVDQLENLYVLDTSSCYVYKFDKRGALVTRFFVGRGATCIAIRSDGYIAIGYGGEVKLFHPSRLMKVIDKANESLLEGDYDLSVKYWNEALRLNNYMKFIHSGLGETYLYMKEYRSALREFKLAEDKSRYSNTVVLYRREIFYRYMILWGILFLIVINILVFLG